MFGDNTHPAPMADKASQPTAKRQKVDAPPAHSTNGYPPHLLLPTSHPPTNGIPQASKAQMYTSHNRSLDPAVAAPSPAIHTSSERRNDPDWQRLFPGDTPISGYYPAALGGNGHAGARRISRNHPDLPSSHPPNPGPSLGGSWSLSGVRGNYAGQHDPPRSSGHSGAGSSALNGPRSDEYDLVIDTLRSTPRPVRSTGPKKPALQDIVIDLTQDDEEDGVQGAKVVITKSGKRGTDVSRNVCYGAVKTGRIMAIRVPTFPPGAASLRAMELSVARTPQGIEVSDCKAQRFGMVDGITAETLISLHGHAHIGFKLQLFLYPLKAIPNQLVRPNTTLPFFYNVYAPENQARQVAGVLAYYSVFLEAPHGGYFREPYMPLPAPTPPISPGPARRSDGYSGVIVRTAEEVREDVNKVFDGLEEAENLLEMDPDPRIKTPLLKHQKQGLYFLVSKERSRACEGSESKTPSLWKMRGEGTQSPHYFHVITGQELAGPPPDVLGGILADMMGLGKTLQVLSLIVTTLTEAQLYGASPEPAPRDDRDSQPSPPIMRAKTTLLIAPLSTISNWEEQIQAHIQPGTITYHLYHGNRRRADPNFIAEHDIVITTYQVIASEWSKHMKDKPKYVSPLQQIRFFRIVLDGEAHVIREQARVQSKAVIALHAERRWAVTGTPIQNRLEDFAALTKFLRVRPFDEKSVFNQHFIIPIKTGEVLENGDHVGLLALRALVNSITLRRLKDKIELPERADKIVYLRFSSDEQEVYDATAKQSAKRIDMVAKQGHVGGKGYVHILQMILRLRLICAHGRELLGDEDNAELAGLTSSDAINVDEIDESESNLPPKQAYQIFSLMKETNEDVCSLCGKKAASQNPIGVVEESAKIDENEKSAEEKERPQSPPIGYLTPCAHILCIQCKPLYIDRIEKHTLFSPGMRAHCPICGLYSRIHLFELKDNELRQYQAGGFGAGKHLKKKDVSYRGPSTKVKALIQALLENRKEGTPEDPIKSVVFSAWTSHMDLIERAFDDNGIRHVRLDGSQQLAQRTAAITRFREEVEIEVILVSLMAGGLGLNLTAACRVYVMEPQWNPAAEAQAIDRIHRMGQKNKVVTVRYIMQDSFEEKILKIQDKKNRLADLTMQRGKRMSKEQMAKLRIENLRDLFSST